MAKRSLFVMGLVLSVTLLFAAGGGEAADDGVVTLRVTMIRDLVPIFEALATEYREMHPDVAIEVDVFGDSTAIIEGIPRVFNSDDAPDISFYFHVATTGYPAMKRNGLLAPMNDVYEDAGLFEAMSASLLNQYLTTGGNDGNYYAVPLGGVLYSFLYTNTQVFRDLGIEPPRGEFRNETAFRSLVAELEADGVTALATGFGDGDSMVKHLSDNVMVRMVRPEMYLELQSAGFTDTTRQARFTDPEVTAVHAKILEWYEDLFPEGTLARTHTDASLLFIQGRAAIFPDGTWNVANMAANAPEVEYEWFAWPQIRPDVTPRVIGFFGDALIVSPDSPHIEAAKDFVRFAVSRRGQEIIMGFGRLPMRTDFDEATVLGLLGSPAGEMFQLAQRHGIATGFHDSHPIELRERYVRLLLEMLAGRETPQSVGEKVEALARRLERGE